MARINLLPWREELRKERQKEFGILMGCFVVVAAIVVGLAHWINVQQIQYQEERNQFLTGKIADLDKRIKEIQSLEKEKQRLIDRIRAIEGLQSNRPLIVRFFDELVNALPDGVSVTEINQKGEAIIIHGEAQSNARVSSLMRNLEKSQWLKDPKLDIIQTRDAKGTRISSFTLRFSQVVPKAEGEDT